MQRNRRPQRNETIDITSISWSNMPKDGDARETKVAMDKMPKVEDSGSGVHGWQVDVQNPDGGFPTPSELSRRCRASPACAYLWSTQVLVLTQFATSSEPGFSLLLSPSCHLPGRSLPLTISVPCRSGERTSAPSTPRTSELKSVAPVCIPTGLVVLTQREKTEPSARQKT